MSFLLHASFLHHLSLGGSQVWRQCFLLQYIQCGFQFCEEFWIMLHLFIGKFHAQCFRSLKGAEVFRPTCKSWKRHFIFSNFIYFKHNVKAISGELQPYCTQAFASFCFLSRLSPSGIEYQKAYSNSYC